MLVAYSRRSQKVSLRVIIRNVKGKYEGFVLDGQPQLVLEGLDILIRRQVRSIKARMAP